MGFGTKYYPTVGDKFNQGESPLDTSYQGGRIFIFPTPS